MLDPDMPSPSAAALHGAPGHTALSRRTVVQLGIGEQLMLWAFRQRLHDGDMVSAVLAQGFRLAVGPADESPTLIAFDRLFRTLAAHAREPLGLCPLRCYCLSLDEERLLQLVTVAQLGSERALEAIVAALVDSAGQPLLRQEAMVLGLHLRRAEIELPLRIDLVPAAAVH